MQCWALTGAKPGFDHTQKVAENTKLLYANFFVYGMLTARNRTASFVSLHSPNQISCRIRPERIYP
jgi:hypothetical protein